MITLVDVGGAGGIQPEWLPIAASLTPVLFEPNPIEAAKLRVSTTQAYPNAIVVEGALSNQTGLRTLNIAQYWGCTSLLEPNMTLLSQYRVAPAFTIVGKKEVFCERYEELYWRGAVPSPDVIKVDVQGSEYEVLNGFGDLLIGCLGIELETHLYPIYHDQKLLQDIVKYLAQYGFVLRRLEPVANFDGDLIECNVWFTKRRALWLDLDMSAKSKFQTISDIWKLISYEKIDFALSHDQYSSE